MKQLRILIRKKEINQSTQGRGEALDHGASKRFSSRLAELTWSSFASAVCLNVFVCLLICEFLLFAYGCL